MLTKKVNSHTANAAAATFTAYLKRTYDHLIFFAVL